MINLREYQLKSISALRNNIKSGFKKLILCAPTGAG
jgi:superfamily II DNA or RNA helicase